MESTMSENSKSGLAKEISSSLSLNTNEEESGEKYTHLAPECRALADLSNDARIELLRRGVVFDHSEYKVAMDYAHWLLTQPSGVAPRGLLLTGEPGAGKSTFGEELVRLGQGRVLMIQAGGARNMRDVYGRVIVALNGLVSKTMHTPDRQNTVLRLFKSFDIRGLVVDEIQDLKRGTQREHEQVLMSLKTLMNEARVALFCLGTPEAKQVLLLDKHLKARLRAFEFSHWKVDQALFDLLGLLEASLPLRCSSDLCNNAVLEYLVKISEGSLREIMGRITCAAVRAILSGEERLDLKGLQAASEPPPRPRTAGGTL